MDILRKTESMVCKKKSRQNDCRASLHEKVHQRFVRNPTKDPLLLMEGKLPDYSDEEYIPVTAKIGDCIVIHGSVVHKSGRNTTNRLRTIYTYHVVEKGASWSEKNWAQPTEKLPFPSMYDN